MPFTPLWNCQLVTAMVSANSVSAAIEYERCFSLKLTILITLILEKLIE